MIRIGGNWRRYVLPAVLAAGGVVTILNVVALAMGEDREDRLMGLLGRCDRPQRPATAPASPQAAGAPHPPGGPRPGGPAGQGDGKASPQDAQAERIAQRGIFAPPAGPPAFQDRLIGVLGDEAIFQSGQIVKVGAEVAGAKLARIGPNWAEIIFQGRPQRLEVFAGDGGGGPGGPPPGMPPGMMAPGGRIMLMGGAMPPGVKMPPGVVMPSGGADAPPPPASGEAPSPQPAPGTESSAGQAIEVSGEGGKVEVTFDLKCE